VLQELYGDAVRLCAADAADGATQLPASTGDAWDAAMAAVCRASLDMSA
jgi:hypothetical protein